MDIKNRGIDKQQFKVASYHMDMKGLLSVHSIAALLQETAGNHAHKYGFGYHQMIEDGHIWVLTRLKLEINNLPEWNEELTIYTWIVNREKFFSRRDFRIENQKGEILINAASGWMLLDLNTKRPKLVEDLKMSIPILDQLFAIDTEFEKIETIDEPELNRQKYTVRYSDLDINKHINNAQYIRILLDALPFETINTKLIKSFEINYLSEATIGDEFKIITGRKTIENQVVFFQEIIRIHDGKTICRAKSNWRCI